MILIAKKQRIAHQSAKNLIDFENIVVDTDFGGAVSFRSIQERGSHLSGDPDDIIEDLANGIHGKSEEAGHVKKDSLVRQRKLGGQKRLGKQPSAEMAQQIEMRDFNNMSHFVIDDDEEDDEMS